MELVCSDWRWSCDHDARPPPRPRARGCPSSASKGSLFFMIGSNDEVAACQANDEFRENLLEAQTVVCRRCVLIGTTLRTLLISGVRNSCTHHFHVACACRPPYPLHICEVRLFWKRNGPEEMCRSTIKEPCVEPAKFN